MTQQIATTPEQGKRILACGVDPKSADFVWMEDKPNNPRLTLRSEIIEDSNPCIVEYGWSLGRILAILPPEVEVDLCVYYLEVIPNWRLSYTYYDYPLNVFDADDLIECCVKAIEWLTKNGYKLDEIKQ